MLNIVNNVPGLQMGVQLRDFKAHTKDMDPVTRGEMIDDFHFVKRIHNSFARENDLLTADMHAKEKFARQKKKAATAKAQATKAAKKAEKDAKEEALNGVAKLNRAVACSRAPAANVPRCPSTKASKPLPKAVHSADTSSEPEEDSDFKLNVVAKSRPNVSVQAPRKPDEDFKTEQGETIDQPRRSNRARKPPNRGAYVSEANDEAAQEGFHFIAYMPIQNHVWKLDGLDYHPHDLGSFGLGGNGADGGTGNWMHVVAPALQGRMAAAQEQGEISFTLLAVVHDPMVDDRRDLCQNIKILQTIDRRLDELFEDWRSLDGAETSKDTLLGPSHELDIFAIDIDATTAPTEVIAEVSSEEDFMALIEYRKPFLKRQVQIRSSIRSAQMMERADEEQARQRRHDYATFVRKWLSALAEQEVLSQLIE